MNNKETNLRIQISVVVACYNGVATISRCLSALLNQTIDKKKYEVIVVDSSGDDTPNIIKEQFPEVSLIHLPERTRTGPANTIGIKEARGNLIALIAADCIAEPDTLQRMIESHEEGKYEAIGGAIINGTPYSPMGWIYYLTEFNGYAPWDPKRGVKHFPGNHGCYRRETFEKYGFYHTGNFTAEDRVLNTEIINQGGKLLFDPSIKVTHLNPTNLRSYLKAQLRLGYGSAMSRRRMKGMKGQCLVRYPILVLGLPFYRFGVILFRLFRTNLKALFILMMLSPIFFIGLCIWTIGFFKGVAADEKDVWGGQRT